MAPWTGNTEHPVTATGALTEWLSASDTVTGYAGVQFVATAFTGVIQCQGSGNDGVTSIALALVNMNDGSAIAGTTGITAAGYYRADVGSIARFRWYCSSFTSQTAAYIYPTERAG